MFPCSKEHSITAYLDIIYSKRPYLGLGGYDFVGKESRHQASVVRALDSHATVQGHAPGYGNTGCGVFKRGVQN